MSVRVSMCVYDCFNFYNYFTIEYLTLMAIGAIVSCMEGKRMTIKEHNERAKSLRAAFAMHDDWLVRKGYVNADDRATTILIASGFIMRIDADVEESFCASLRAIVESKEEMEIESSDTWGASDTRNLF